MVGQEEFDKAVRAANDGNGFIAQRTYSAPDQDTIDAYRDQLYSGKFYVDCSTGGAQYGQGMYCAADYTGTLSPGIKEEMRHYQSLGMSRVGKYSQQDLEYIARDQKARADDVLRRYKAGEIGKNEGAALYRRINEMQPSEYVATYMKGSNITGARSYVETLTLDPSAKVITYEKLFAEFNEYKMKASSIFFEKYVGGLSGYSDDFKTVLRSELGIGKTSFNTVMEAYKRIEDTKEFGEMGEILTAARKRATQVEMDAYRMNIGSYAGLKGYDAINAVGHGQSGSYTVVLNRTKMIILGGK